MRTIGEVLHGIAPKAADPKPLVERPTRQVAVPCKSKWQQTAL